MEAIASAPAMPSARMESNMKLASFFADDSNVNGAWANLARALAFPAQPRSGTKPVSTSSGARPGILQRLDRWLWKQQMREREAYLAGAKDIFELEERMRHLDRGTPFPYY
jgi:hypothetical protein